MVADVVKIILSIAATQIAGFPKKGRQNSSLQIVLDQKYLVKRFVWLQITIVFCNDHLENIEVSLDKCVLK